MSEKQSRVSEEISVEASIEGLGKMSVLEALSEDIDPRSLDIYSSHHTTPTSMGNDEVDDQ